jgi:hypothetical protein
MKAILTFDTEKPGDSKAFERAKHANEMAAILWAIVNDVHNDIEFNESPSQYSQGFLDGVERMRAEIYRVMDGASFNINKIQD